MGGLMKYKPGDPLLCIEAHGRQLTNGKIYYFISYQQDGSYSDLLEVVDDTGQKQFFWQSRFVYAEKYIHEQEFSKKIDEWIGE